MRDRGLRVKAHSLLWMTCETHKKVKQVTTRELARCVRRGRA